MKKQNIYVSIVIIIIAVALGFLLLRRQVQAPAVSSINQVNTDTSGVDAANADPSAVTGDRTVNLSCDDNKTVDITFHLPADKTADIVLSDGRSMSLLNTSTQSDSSYTSADGSTVLALNGSTVQLTESGTVTYANCTLASSSVPVAGADNGNSMY